LIREKYLKVLQALRLQLLEKRIIFLESSKPSIRKRITFIGSRNSRK
jgi:hypothetical protein